MRLLRLTVLVALGAFSLIADQKVFDPSKSDPRAVAISKEVLNAMGGQAAWDRVRFLRFDFTSEREGKQNVIRSHWWDKHTGRHRVEGKTREGEPWLVLHDLNTRQGRAWKSGVELTGEDAQKMLDNAYGAWINDTYWLLMPYKLNDPGVTLGYDGEETIDGTTYDKVTLSFDNVGLTPKDRYWAYINRDTHLMDRWAYILKGGEGPATAWQWKGWTRHGGVMLAPERVALEGGNKLILGNLAVSESMPDAVFTSPGKP
jgi:hypothetical protein